MPPATAAIPSASLTPFRPAPEAAAAIFERIASGRESLADLAADHNTSLEALALWLESPDAQDRLASISAGLATFARIGALARIPAATGALHSILTDFNQRCARATAASAAASASATASPSNPNSPAPSTSAPAAPDTAAAPAPVSSPMDDFRERRLIYSVACLILRITRTPDRPRPAPVSSASPAHATSPAPSRDQSAHSPAHAHPHADSALRGLRPLRPDAAAIDPFARPERPAKAPGPADRLERLADPAVRARQSRDSWLAEVRREVATIVEPEDLPQVLESMTQMDDDLICEMLRCAAAEGRGQPPPSSPRNPPPSAWRGSPPSHSPPPPRHTPKRDSPGALLAAAGAPGPHGPAP